MSREQSAYGEAAEWLVENGYTKGYATFWNGNVMTELSNGVLDVYVYDEWSDTQLYGWLQRKSHMEELPEGPVFVLVSGTEYYTEDIPCAREEHLVYESAIYGTHIYAYDSAQEVAALQQAQNQ